MGQIICPDGTSLQSDKFNSSVPFEYLVRDMKSECCTNEYRAKCVSAIGEVGLFSQAKEIGSYIQRLIAETESDVVRSACKEVIKKYKIKRKKPDREINEYLQRYGIHC